MRLPSIDTIESRLRTDRNTARSIRKALEECRDVRGNFSDRVLKALKTADSLIGGHGVEYIRSSEDTMHSVEGIEYVNMGDTYRTTVLFDWARGTFDICPWGNIVESAPESRYV